MVLTRILIFLILFTISSPEFGFCQSYDCSKKRYCQEMSTCEEAIFYFKYCGFVYLDADGDGIPCENLCRTSYKNYSQESYGRNRVSKKEFKFYILLFTVLLSIIYLIFKLIFSKLFKKNQKKFSESKINHSIDKYLNLDNNYIVRNNIEFFHNKEKIFIDHAVISEYGIFFIKIIKLDGWIFGKEDDKYWTQVLFKIKKRIENPLPKMKELVENLSEELKIDYNTIHPIIFFLGNVEFKTLLPKNVINKELEKYILSFKNKVFEKKKINDILQKLSKYW